MADDLLPPDDGNQGLTPPPIRMWMLILAIAAAFLFAGAVVIQVVGSNRAASATAQKAAERAQHLVKQIQRESDERRDQTCKIFEGGHLDDINRLKATYAFLSDPKNRHGSLTPAIVQSLPALEKRARTDSAPQYCDEPGAAAEAAGAKPIGNPEPDPVPPKRRDFSYLLKP